RAIDLVVIDSAASTITPFINSPSGLLEGGAVPTANADSGFLNPTGVTLTDIDDDGRLDALVSHLTRGFSILRGQQGRYQLTPGIGEMITELDFGFVDIPDSSFSGVSPEPLTNSANPFDVNDDGFVSAVDALRIINRLNQTQAAGEPAGNTATTNPPNDYFDVSGDGRVTALDALMVINRLNSEALRPTESISPEPIATSPTPNAISSEDASFSQIDRSTSDPTDQVTWPASTVDRALSEMTIDVTPDPESADPSSSEWEWLTTLEQQ
ncbi:MAG: dockerin type I domain-containing protein, partial [Planctomycetota bacterium]